jgi:hypothetical protein
LVNPSEWTLILLYGFFWGAGLWVFKNLWASEKKMRQAWSPLARLAYFVGHVLVGLGVALLSTFGQRVTHGGPLRVFVTVVVGCSSGVSTSNFPSVETICLTLAVY